MDQDEATQDRPTPPGSQPTIPVGSGSDETADRGETSFPPPGAGPRFRILRPHARGGLGEVFVARDGELGREVALKRIQERQADRPDSRARFLREAELTARLEHPGVVPVYGLGQDADGRPYYAMRLIRGETLRAALDRFHAARAADREPGGHELDLRRMLSRFVEVCDAVAYAHSRGILHRDLKPDNVMLGPFGEVLVVDWGLAKAIGGAEPAGGDDPSPPPCEGGGLTLEGASLGTPQFMSPEQARGDLRGLGPATDVYSLGAILYYLLTGRPPFEGGALTPLLSRVAAGDFPPPRRLVRSLPKGLEAICLKAMATRPEARHATARALADDVERWMADEPISARRDPIPTRLARWLKRRPSLLPGIAVLAIVDLAMVLESAGVRGLLGRRVDVLKTSVALMAAVAAIFVQFHALIGGGIGAVHGLFRGGVVSGLERGVTRGLRTGLVLAALGAGAIGLVLLYDAVFGRG